MYFSRVLVTVATLMLAVAYGAPFADAAPEAVAEAAVAEPRDHYCGVSHGHFEIC